jgi:hypothetical protein
VKGDEREGNKGTGKPGVQSTFARLVKKEGQSMNLKSKLMGLIAGVGMLSAIVSPTIAADVNSNTANVTVTLTEDGVFAVSITSASLSDTGTSAITGGTSTGAVNIKYQDTKSFRAGFDTKLYANDFTSSLAVPYTSPATTYGIDATNLKITRNYDTIQARCSCPSGGGPRIGDIGPTSNGLDNDHSGGPYNPANTNGFGRFHDWTSAVNNSLDSTIQPLISFGFRGPGTAASAVLDGSTQRLEIALTVPSGQPATTYTTTLHVDVTFGWDPI